MKTFLIYYVNSADSVNEITAKATTAEEAKRKVKQRLGRECYRIIEVRELINDSFNLNRAENALCAFNEFNKVYEELSDINEAKQKKYEISYREEEDGPKKRFTVVANSEAEAKQMAWSRVDADDIWVTEIQEDLQEANKIVSRVADNSWYSGGFAGLNDISTRFSPEERERKAKEEEERKLEAERKNFEKAAQKAIAEDRVPFYNCNHKYEIRGKEHCPAIDLETKELVYDPTQKEEIIEASQVIVDQKRQASAEKGLQTRRTRANNQAIQNKTYLWTAYYNLGSKTSIVVEEVLGNDDPEGACERVKQKALAELRQEMHECRVFNEPFLWDGKLLITITNPQGHDRTYKQLRFKIN